MIEGDRKRETERSYEETERKTYLSLLGLI